MWLSKFSSLASFKQLIENKVLKPTPSISVVVNIVDVDDASLFPITTCESCALKLQESHVLEAMKAVKWKYVHTRMYDIEKEVCDSS